MRPWVFSFLPLIGQQSGVCFDHTKQPVPFGPQVTYLLLQQDVHLFQRLCFPAYVMAFICAVP
jgi:hypothetical protein